MFGFPFNGDTMILPNVQKWQTDEIELSRRMIKARDSQTARTPSKLKIKSEMVLESLIQAWTTFAKTGNPGWARYEAKDKVIKNFDSEDSLRFEYSAK